MRPLLVRLSHEKTNVAVGIESERAARTAALLPPPAADDRPVPAKQRAWRDEPQRVQRPRQVTRSGSEERAISRLERGPGNLPAQDIELVTEDHQLEVLQVRAAWAADEQAEQSPNSEIGEGEEHAADTPTTSERGHDRGNGTLHGDV